MTSKKRWQDWILLLGGIWLFVAPWALGTSSDTGSSWNAWTLGVLVTGTAWWALTRPADKWTGWLQVLYGAWLFVAAWLLGFTGLAAAAWNAWLVAVGVVGLAAWVIAAQASTPGKQTGVMDAHQMEGHQMEGHQMDDHHLAQGSH
ncbi:MAG: SPW repeat protein [Actinobacteria bacterium]|nr:SPW repeat protein [Actinomycetota bacterium]